VSLRRLASHHPLFRIHRANLASVPPRHPLLNRYAFADFSHVRRDFSRWPRPTTMSGDYQLVDLHYFQSSVDALRGTPEG